MARPTEVPTWATSGSADVDEPSAQRKALGWIAGQPPPAGQFNWWMNLVGSWLTWLAGVPALYDDPADAYDAMEDGEVALVWQKEQGRPGADNTAFNLGFATISDLDVDGRRLYYCTASLGYRRLRTSAAGAAEVTYTPTNAGTVLSIATNGLIVVLAYGNYVEAFTASTGASLWVYDHAAAVRDVCLDLLRVYACGEPDGGGHEVVALNITDGSVLASYDHNGSCYAICTDGKSVVVAGAASGHASGASLRRLTISLADATNEGGTSADTTGVAWNQVQLVAQDRQHTLATDGTRLFCGYGTGGPANSVEVRSLITGVSYVARMMTAGDLCRSISCDQDQVFAGIESAAGDGIVYGFDKNTLWPTLRTTTRVADPVLAVVSDGASLWYGVQTAATYALYKTYRGRDCPRPWRRMDHDSGAEPFTPWARAIYPLQT